MIKVKDCEKAEVFHSLINPGKPIPIRITTLTGITDEDVLDSPTFHTIGKAIEKFVDNNVIVAHNGSFDAGFLSKEFSNCGISKKLVYFDTLALARKAYPALKSHKLSSLISYLGIATTQSHRALDDAEQTYELFKVIYAHYCTPYAQAVASCCTPIIDYQIETGDALPLQGKHLVLMGDFTFSMKAAKKLITLA